METKILTKIGVIGVSLAFIIAASISSPAYAVDSPDKYSSFTKEELEDAKTYASDSGTEIQTVLAEMEGQVDFSSGVDDLREKYPEYYVDATWSVDKPEIVLSAGVPDAVLQVARNYSDVVIRDVPTEAKRLETTESVYQAALKLEGVTSATAYSTQDGAVELTVALSPSGKDKLSSRSTVSLEESFEKDLRKASDLPVHVSVSSESDLGSTEIRGGLAYKLPSGKDQCTAAFVVKSGGITGISTAEHCESLPKKYDGVTIATQRILSKGQGDVRWARATSSTVKPSKAFQYDYSKFRSVSRTSNPAVGTIICKFGLTHGYKCSKVYKTGVCSIGYCNLHAATDYISRPGDSGGPWFSGTVAMGIHHGQATINGKKRSLFTRIGAVNLINAVVYTG